MRQRQGEGQSCLRSAQSRHKIPTGVMVVGSGGSGAVEQLGKRRCAVHHNCRGAHSLVSDNSSSLAGWYGVYLYVQFLTSFRLFGGQVAAGCCCC